MNNSRSMTSRLRSVLVTIAIALAGAVGFLILNVPAAALVGATVTVTIAALLRLRPVVPEVMRDAGFSVIGITLGAGVTPTFFSDVAHFPLSLAALTVTMVFIMTVSGLVLTRLSATDSKTAILSTSPGALTYSLALAAEGAGDVRYIMVMQSLRLLLITVFLPPLIGFTNHAAVGGSHALRAVLGPLDSVVLLAIAAVVGVLFQRLRVPAAWLLAGLLVSGLAHGFGFVSGRLAAPFTFLGFTVAGAVVGSRFAGISLEELRTLGVAGVVATLIAVGIAAISSFFVALALSLPFAQVLVSFAPGGVEGMSSMALALGYDPVFVATHHIFRIMALILLLPVLLKRAET